MKSFIYCLIVLTFVLYTGNAKDSITINPVINTQKLAIIPFDYAQDDNQIPISKIEEGFFTSEYSIKAFFEEISYGKVTIEGIVYPYRTNQPPLYGTGYTSCYPNDSVLANQPDVDYSVIDGIILFPHDTASDKSCAAGVSSFQKLPFNTIDGKYEFRRSGFRTEFYFPKDFSQTTSSTIAHELMHSFGNSFHSNSYIKSDGEWVLQGYGNVFDILGLRSQASHPCSMLKHKLGWLTENEIQYVQQTDTFRLYPLEKDLPGQTQCLIIDLPNQIDLDPEDDFKFDLLYLEYRGLTGFDSRSNALRRVRLKDESYFANENLHGLSIIGVDCNSTDDCLPMLIDMHPEPIGGIGAAYFPHEASDAPLKLSEKYNVENNAIEIEVINISQENYIDVSVKMPTTSISNENKILDFKVQQSMNGDQIYITTNYHLDYKVNLHDINGKVIISEMNLDHIDISNFSNGVYFLVIRDINNKSSYIKSIIKL
jgi:hypothetical protein